MSRKDEGRERQGPMDVEDRHEVPPTSRGNTVSAQGGTQQPKVQTPNEVDESSHSQADDNPGGRRLGKMAHDGVVAGQQDTSKGQELDAAYHAVRKASEPAPVDKANRKGRR
jgi:hypothetical protein